MIDGIDVSYVQTANPIDWKKLSTVAMGPNGTGGPCRFMWVQSSKYSSVADGTFKHTVDAARKVGIRPGAYHFCSQNHDAKTTTDPEQQMEFFFKASGGLGVNEGELPPMIDWEYSKVMDRKWNVKWLVKAAVTAKNLWYPRSQSVRRPQVYTYPWFAIEHREYLIDSGIEEVADLVFASYKSSAITPDNKWGLIPWYPSGPEELPLHKIPAPWLEKHLKTVQYSGDRGLPVPGISGYTDRMMFRGSAQEFDEYCGIWEDYCAGPKQKPTKDFAIVHPDVPLIGTDRNGEE